MISVMITLVICILLNKRELFNLQKLDKTQRKLFASCFSWWTIIQTGYKRYHSLWYKINVNSDFSFWWNMIMFLISYTACLELLDTKAIKNILFSHFWYRRNRRTFSVSWIAWHKINNEIFYDENFHLFFFTKLNMWKETFLLMHTNDGKLNRSLQCKKC